MRIVSATRYVTPLREGGSLPAIVEADDDGTYVLKFRGAGQGAKSLIAELVAGEIARTLGLPVPEIVLVELDPLLGRSEPDSEIRELIKASEGLNLALDYLPGSVSFDPLVPKAIENNAPLASEIVWFDSFVTNVDRTARNTNMLVWHKELWLIDHGASLYFHHSWDDYLQRSSSRFPQIKDHVLLPFANDLQSADEKLAPLLTPEVLSQTIELIPDSWLLDAPFSQSEESQSAESSTRLQRDAYLEYLVARLQRPRLWVEEAQNARRALV